MKKKNLVIFILLVAIFFGFGYFTAILRFENKYKQNINVFGTYTNDSFTISINHDLTYQYSYPFTSGKLLEFDKQVYKMENGDLDGYIAIFSDNNLKLIDIKEETILKQFTKIMPIESVLNDSN